MDFHEHYLYPTYALRYFVDIFTSQLHEIYLLLASPGMELQVKYIFKYIYMEPDRAAVTADVMEHHDEVASFQNLRYFSAAESLRLLLASPRIERPLNAVARSSALGVVEFQCRGLTHAHILLEVDGAGRQMHQVGRQIILGSSFVSGPRDIKLRYQDAMAIARETRAPSYLITMTCNTRWPEIAGIALQMGISDLVVDHLSALEYVTKYATKQEKGSKASEKLIGQIDQPEDPSHINKAAWICCSPCVCCKRMI